MHSHHACQQAALLGAIACCHEFTDSRRQIIGRALAMAPAWGAVAWDEPDIKLALLGIVSHGRSFTSPACAHNGFAGRSAHPRWQSITQRNSCFPCQLEPVQAWVQAAAACTAAEPIHADATC